MLGSTMDSQLANQGWPHVLTRMPMLRVAYCLLFFTSRIQSSALLVVDAPTCVCKGSIHNKMTKFYAEHQPIGTLCLFPGYLNF